MTVLPNLDAALFCFSFSLMLSYEEACNLLSERINMGYIDENQLKIEYDYVLENTLNWKVFLSERELLSNYQAEIWGEIKCREYFMSLFVGVF